MSNLFDDQDKSPAMTPEERQAAIDKFHKKGGKITKCPTRVADETIWLGGRPKSVEVTTTEEVSDES